MNTIYTLVIIACIINTNLCDVEDADTYFSMQDCVAQLSVTKPRDDEFFESIACQLTHPTNAK